MIIHQPEITKKDGYTILWSRIEMAQKRDRFPDFLWYRVPNQFERCLSLQSDAFLVPGLLAGMYFREHVEVRGIVSPKLAYNLEEYQYVLNFRMPDAVRPVKITYDRLEASPQKSQGVGTTFSGGVDSLFTLWEHMPPYQTIRDYQISHAIFIMGFDIRYKDRSKYLHFLSKYQQALHEINIELLPLETNLVSLIVPRMIYAHFYGPVLAGSAHLFGGILKRFIIPSSRDYFQLREWTSSSDPLSDPLLSSNTLDIIHHGATHSRIEKIAAISNWEFAQGNLRVCFSRNADQDFLNCSRCEKCTRTMIPLYALGKMEAFKTFKYPFKHHWDGFWLARKFNPFHGYDHEFSPFVKQNRPDFLLWLRLAIWLGYCRYWLLKLIPGFVKKKLQRFGYFIDDRQEEDIFDDPSIIAVISS